MSEPSNEAGEKPQTHGARASVTPVRLVVWILGAGFAIYLIVTGVVGILTKAR